MRKINIRLIAMSAALLAGLSSCNDIVTYNDNYDDGMTSTGTPVINMVYDADDTEKTAPIVSAAFEDMVVLSGDNLIHVTRVAFNDVEVPLSEVYATAKNVYLPIPRRVPEEVTNKLSTVQPLFMDVLASRLKGIAESISRDGGRTWSPPELSRTLSGPNTRFFIRRLKSGRLLLVNNDSTVKRERMTAYLSEDDGLTWPYRLLLYEDADVSYPDGTEAPDGRLYLIYDYARNRGGYIFLARITEADILAGKPVSPNSVRSLEIDHSRPVPT